MQIPHHGAESTFDESIFDIEIHIACKRAKMIELFLKNKYTNDFKILTCIISHRKNGKHPFKSVTTSLEKNNCKIINVTEDVNSKYSEEIIKI